MLMCNVPPILMIEGQISDNFNIQKYRNFDLWQLAHQNALGSFHKSSENCYYVVDSSALIMQCLVAFLRFLSWCSGRR